VRKLNELRRRRLNPDAVRPVASPIAHSFAGFWTFLVFIARLRGRLASICRRYLGQLVLLVALANLADIDFLFGLGTEANANALHHGFTHSLTAAVLVAFVVSWAWRIATTFWRSVVLCFLAYASHLLIDMCSGPNIGWNDTASGIPLFWPWTNEFRSPLVLVVGVNHKDLSALFSVANAWSSFYELLTFGAITLGLLALRGRG
jgi:membrane-bound metal-dependent hydrolase YbcI (DUF457 family)